ncbi:YxD-tail cyclophane-containing RiPP peptide [Streptomyces sp. YIM S03343]
MLPEFGDLNLLTLSRQSGHPVLAAVAAGLLPRTLSGRPPMAFYEDGPYQL